ncbi:hypothetical protein ACTND8_05990 [Atopobiaceae bacterium HCP3S3_F7]
MSDLDRYLTDEVRERAAEAIASHNFDVHVPSWSIRCAGCDWSELGGVVELHDQHLADLALSAVLPDIIRQAKAEARPVTHLRALFEGDTSLCGNAQRPERFEPDCPECLAEFERRGGSPWRGGETHQKESH